MLRKFIAVLIFMLVLSSCNLVQAAPKQKKYTGPLLMDCNIYQLGGDEFILKLQGQKLTEPAYEIDNNSINIILNNTNAANPENINSSILELIETYPLIYGFYVQPVSEDKIYTTYVHIDTTLPLKMHSLNRSKNGFTMRIKAERDKNNLSLSNMTPPPSFSSYNDKPLSSKKSSGIIFPESTLPFKSDIKITVAFRDADLQDVLRAFMEYLGRNMVLDASFPKDEKVTMSLVDVRVDDVINYLLRTYDLACYAYGPNITAFGANARLYKLSGAPEIKIFKIAYADPSGVAAMLKALLGLSYEAANEEKTVGSGSGSGSSSSSSSSSSGSSSGSSSVTVTENYSYSSEVVVDERMRTLYIHTNPAKMKEVEDLISRIDVPQQQVLIRASIFEFNDTATREVESALEAAYDEWTISTRRGLSIGYNEVRRGDENSDSNSENSILLQTPSTLRALSSLFTALESKNKGRVLANPSVITLEGQQATIQLTQNYIYSNTKDDAGNLVTQQQEIGPTLIFTPQIERNGYVYLNIDLTTGDVVGSFNDAPITSKRHVQTNIRVRDGQPFVIGGLFQDNKSRTTTKIPVIGDIPLVGNLFSYRTGTNQRTQAVMVVTPYILDSN